MNIQHTKRTTMNSLTHHALSTNRSLILVALAGSVLVLPACGPKRAGFWNKNKQSQLQHDQAHREQAQADARRSAYFSAGNSGSAQSASTQMASTYQSNNQTLRSNAPATINYAQSAESQPGAFTPSSNSMNQAASQPTNQSAQQTTTFTAVSVPTETSFSTPTTASTSSTVSTSTAGGSSSIGSASSTSSGSSSDMQQLRMGTADQKEPTKRDPYFAEDTKAPAALRSGDISAFVYANAMGVELPSETNPDATRATINVRQVTSSYAGSDFDPIVTPDGQYLIFASTQHRPTADLYIKSVNGSVVTRLTDDPAQDVMPAISPDGQFITFASDRGGSWDLYIMPFEGGKVVQLTNESANDLHPTWSPDGRQIAFCRLGQQSGRWEIWVKDVLADNGAQFIGFGLFPEWCPVSGTGIAGADQILFQRSRERGDRAFSVWTLDFNPNPGTAGRETEIATGPNQALINPSWSPDGQFVTFAAVPNSESWSNQQTARPDSSTIWMVSTKGTGKIKLTDGNSIDLMPVWGRNNDIFFVSNMDGQDHLWSMELSPAIKAASVMMPGINDSFATFPTDSQNPNP